MSIGPYRRISRAEVAFMTSEPSVAVFLFAMPAVLVGFSAGGVEGGSSQAFAGLSTLFAFFAVNQAGFSYFREHGWSTWERLRTLPLSLPGVLAAKLLPYAVLVFVQLHALFLLSDYFLRVELAVNYLHLLLIFGSLAVCTSGFTLAFLALTRHVQEFSALANLSSVVLGGIGGAFAATSTMPGWVEGAAHLTPHFWAVEALRHATGEGSVSAGMILPNALVLLGFAFLGAVVAVTRLDLTAQKISWGTS